MTGEEGGEEATEDNFSRLFSAIDFDSSPSPPAQPPLEGEVAETSDWGGWLAVSLNLRASEVRYVGVL